MKAARNRRCRRWSALVAFLVLSLLGVMRPAVGRAGEPASQNADVIVVFSDGTDPVRRDRVLRDAGAEPRRHFQLVAAAAARLPHDNVRAALEQHPEVVAVVPDRLVQAHGRPGGGGGGGTGQVVPAGVERIGAAPGSVAWTGFGVGVAVLDTGLDFTHADLQPLGTECFTAHASCQDDNGHGTHVGGIIAARNNSIDVVGVAPDVVLYAVKVLDSSATGTDSAVMAGLDWVAVNRDRVAPPIRVVNMSLGRQGTLDDNPALRQAIQALHTIRSPFER